MKKETTAVTILQSTATSKQETFNRAEQSNKGKLINGFTNVVAPIMRPGGLLIFRMSLCTSFPLILRMIIEPELMCSSWVAQQDDNN